MGGGGGGGGGRLAGVVTKTARQTRSTLMLSRHSLKRGTGLRDLKTDRNLSRFKTEKGGEEERRKEG